MTNREILIAMLQDKSKDSALKVYDKFFDVDSDFMSNCVFSTNTREQFAIELDKEEQTAEEYVLKEIEECGFEMAYSFFALDTDFDNMNKWDQACLDAFDKYHEEHMK